MLLFTGILPAYLYIYSMRDHSEWWLFVESSRKSLILEDTTKEIRSLSLCVSVCVCFLYLAFFITSGVLLHQPLPVPASLFPTLCRECVGSRVRKNIVMVGCREVGCNGTKYPESKDIFLRGGGAWGSMRIWNAHSFFIALNKKSWKKPVYTMNILC